MDRPLKILAVARLSGVSAHTLRAWERRYSAVKPARTQTGRRMYSLKDVERLRVLSLLVEQGYGIGNIAHLSDDALKALLAQAASNPGEDGYSLRQHILASVLGPSPEADEARLRTDGKDARVDAETLLRRSLDHLGRFKLRELADTLSLACARLESREFVLGLLAPLIGEVGRQVDRGLMSIAQEHALSATVRDQVALLLKRLEAPRPGRRSRIVLGTAEGELHEFGVLLGAVLCACHGVEFHYLGPNLPAPALAHAAAKLEASVVVLGTSTLANSLLVRPLGAYVRELRKAMPPGCELWVGGQAKVALPSSRGRSRAVRTLEALDGLLKAAK
jgi:DNA-binding transcriptional MerR regulator